MKKIWRTGWIGKEEGVDESIWRGIEREDCWEIADIQVKKGTKKDWPEQDWPPVKVRITIEAVK